MNATLPAPAPTRAASSRNPLGAAVLDGLARRARALRRPERRDVEAFFAAVVRDEADRPLRLDPFSRLWLSTLARCRAERRHVNMKGPPGLGKSIIARGFVAHEIGRDPAIRTASIAADVAAAQDACSLVRSIVLTDAFQDVFPEAKPDYERSRIAGRGKARDERGWRMDGWFLRAAGQRKDPTMGAYACVPKREDLRLEIILADDLVTELTANSLAECEKIERAFFNTWLEGRLSNGGWMIHLQNNRKRGDLGDKLREDRRFCSVFVGVDPSLDRMFARLWHPPEGLPLLADPAAFECEPERPRDGADAEFSFPIPEQRGPEWSRAALQSRNPAALRKLYCLVGSAPEDCLFPSWGARRIARGADAPQSVGLRRGGEGIPIASEDDRMRLAFGAGLDLSGMGRAGNVFSLWSLDTRGVRRPLVLAAFKDVRDAIALADQCWRAGLYFRRLYVETNGVQEQVAALVRSDAERRGTGWHHRIAGFRTGSNKMSDAMGLPAVDSMLALGEIEWPETEARANARWGRLWSAREADYESVTRADAARAGGTPDAIMADWFALSALDGPRPGAPIYSARGVIPEPNGLERF